MSCNSFTKDIKWVNLWIEGNMKPCYKERRNQGGKKVREGQGTREGVIIGESYRGVPYAWHRRTLSPYRSLNMLSVSHSRSSVFRVPSTWNALPAECTMAPLFSSFNSLPNYPLIKESFPDHHTWNSTSYMPFSLNIVISSFSFFILFTIWRK